MEWALIQSYLPIPQQKIENQVSLETLIANWIQWGNMSIHDWSTVIFDRNESPFDTSYRFDQILRNRLWLEAWEKTYEDHLKKMITSNQHPRSPTKQSVCLGTVCLLY